MQNLPNIWCSPKRYHFFEVRAPEKGDLIFLPNQVIFQNKRGLIYIKNLLSVRHIRMQGDFARNWVEITFKELNFEKKLYFSNSESIGLGNLFGGGKQIFEQFQAFFELEQVQIDVAILTPIEVEFEAISKLLKNTKNRTLENGKTYLYGEIHHELLIKRVVVILSNSGISQTTIAASEAIHFFQPKTIILTGIAMGVKEMKIGDIVVGTTGFGYERGKQKETGDIHRPEVINYSLPLIEKARIFARTKKWKDQIEKEKTAIYNPEKVIVKFGRIASGERVIAATNSTLQQFLTKMFDDTLAAEMEGIGLLQLQHWHPQIQFMNIRGISDLGQNKKAMDKLGSQEIASKNVASFVIGLVANYG